MREYLLRKQILLLLIIMMMLTILGVTTPQPALAQGPDINIISDDDTGQDDTTSPRREQPEPSIAINPQNPDMIVAGAQDFRRTTEFFNACSGDRWNGLYVSVDGGQNWENSLIPGFCTDASQGAGSEQPESEMFDLSTNTDPVVAFDNFGNLYYSHIAFNNDIFKTTPPSGSGVLYVSTFRVQDGDSPELTYAKTVKVPSGSGLRQAPFEVGPGSSNFDDKQWMTVDNWPGSPHHGRLYITWTKFGAEGGQSSIWISHCGGDSPGDECDEFSDGKVVNKPVPGGLVQESFPATAPDGTLYIGFIQFQGGFGSTLPHSGIWIATSTDGGEKFTQRRVAQIRQIPSPLPPASNVGNDGNNSFRTGTVPAVGITEDGTVHMVWGEWRDGNQADVRYVRSTDGGQTWSNPINMNDVSTGHQFFPSLVTSGNNVHVAWYDGRNNPAGSTITGLQVFYNRSTDSGAHFEDDVAITDQPFNPNLVSRFPVFCAGFLGDYLDIDAVSTGDGDKVAIIWDDNRNVVNPLTPAECQDFRTRPADATIQGRLDSGALDQEAFVDIFEP